jgi:hypothetical protein
MIWGQARKAGFMGEKCGDTHASGETGQVSGIDRLRLI